MANERLLSAARGCMRKISQRRELRLLIATRQAEQRSAMRNAWQATKAQGLPTNPLSQRETSSNVLSVILFVGAMVWLRQRKERPPIVNTQDSSAVIQSQTVALPETTSSESTLPKPKHLPQATNSLAQRNEQFRAAVEAMNVPISFWGRVVDQDHKPLEGVRIGQMGLEAGQAVLRTFAKRNAVWAHPSSPIHSLRTSSDWIDNGYSSQSIWLPHSRMKLR